MYKNILVCSDGSDNSIKAVRAAADLAKVAGAEVSLLSVFVPSQAYAPTTFSADGGITLGAYTVDVEGVFGAVEKRAEAVFQEVGIQFRTLRETGHPIDTIVKVADREKFDLIVMGSRGMGEFKRMLLGSVSDGVLHHAHCAVLIVR
jgi:nucleotide-binding universal stress UspA family protein